MRYDCIVIGSGPAGVSAAIYLKRANKKVCILEKNMPGGKLNTISDIKNYLGFENISGPDLAMKLFNQINALDIELKTEEAIKLEEKDNYKIVKTKENEYEANNIIIATGRKNKKLNLDKEEELEGRGISYCAVCDGPLYKNKKVVVIGGGESALQESLYLSDFCSNITIINKNNTFKADASLLEKVKTKENVKIIYNAKVIKYNKENDLLSSVVVNVDNEEKTIEASGCFVFIGTEVENELSNAIITDEKGYIIVDEKMQTSMNGVYACGDSIKKEVYQIVTAASEGAIAALDIIKKSK